METGQGNSPTTEDFENSMPAQSARTTFVQPRTATFGRNLGSSSGAVLRRARRIRSDFPEPEYSEEDQHRKKETDLGTTQSIASLPSVCSPCPSFGSGIRSNHRNPGRSTA